MKYVVRAIKYFIYYMLMLVVLMAALYFLNMTDSTATDFPSMFFKDGYDSLKWILIAFAAVSAIYPAISFTGQKAIVPGDYSQVRDLVISFMEDRGYVLEKEEGENLSFRCRSLVRRMTHLWEDRIEYERDFTGFTVKGMRRDIVRIVHGIEAKARN